MVLAERSARFSAVGDRQLVADASRGIIVRKTASAKPMCNSNASVNEKIQAVSKAQMIAVKITIGNISLGLGHMPV